MRDTAPATPPAMKDAAIGWDRKRRKSPAIASGAGDAAAVAAVAAPVADVEEVGPGDADDLDCGESAVDGVDDATPGAEPESGAEVVIVGVDDTAEKASGGVCGDVFESVEEDET